MKKAVMYGAGNIGRGFIGKVFSESGYEVCFVDVDKDIVNKLNEDGSYPVKTVFNNYQTEEVVNNVRAVNGYDIDQVSQIIATTDIMATAVGVNVLPKIVKSICAGLKKRFDKNREPLNIIICENMIDSNRYLRKLIENEMSMKYKEKMDQKLGLVEASIGRMVPIMTDKMREGNILRVWVEPYDKLPIDKAAFVGEIPKLKGLLPYSPFDYYIKRKLFIHNMGHAMFAYLGWQEGYNYIYECVANKQIRKNVYAGMIEMAKALSGEYGIPINDIKMYIRDLLKRFANKMLADTVARVGRDPLRKLRHNDRLIGAALYCLERDIEPKSVIKGVVSALQYDNEDDESAVKMQEIIKNKGISVFLKSNCGIESKMILYEKIITEYK